MLEKIAHIIGMSRQEIESQMKHKKSAFILQRGNEPLRLERADGEGESIKCIRHCSS